MLFAVKIYDIENSGPLRDQYRDAHLDYIASFEDQTMFAGPILTEDLETELGSHRLIDLPDRAAVDKHIEDEPYVVGGAQYGSEVHRWSASVPYTWRDCPRTEGNVQYLIHAIDRPDSDALRNELRAEHEAYQASVESLYITRGPLLSDDGERQSGSLMIIDVPNLAAAKEFWQNEPFVTGGLFERVEFYGWRFGRVFDKFKL
tara:strand:- start:3907 stop:4515 length:609 start_codon:yes stop_codon:yes gene_type:complete